MKFILMPFMILGFIGAAVCFGLSISSYIAPSVRGPNDTVLFFGAFAVWLPTVLVAQRMTSDFKQKDFWKAALRGTPPWLKYLCYASFAYAGVNFLVNGVIAKGSDFSRLAYGHMLPFYLIGASTIYSYLEVMKHDPVRRCPKGHPVSASAQFCDQCGTRIGNA